MRTVLILVGGFLVWGVFMAAARMTGNSPRRILVATLAFVAVWLAVAVVNMYFGVARGYAFREELPIFLVIFLLPAIVALVGQRWLR